MRALVLLAAVAAAARPPAAPSTPARAAPTVVATFEHVLSGATGPIPVGWATVVHDPSRAETYVAGEGLVRIFNAAGMEIHRFGDDGTLGSVARVAVLGDGSLVVLASVDGRRRLLRCDYKGERTGELTLRGLPPGFADLDPDRVVHRDGKLYLAETGSMRVVVTDLDGAHLRSHRLLDLVAGTVPTDKASGMDGFNVDARGNLLFTMSTMFTAGVVSPDGALRLFGARGSRPGTFNIVGGIDADEAGTIYVTDRLRSSVSVWSPDLTFLGEFGYRGDGPGNLVIPFEIAAGNGRVFVAQAANRGVKVFRIQLLAPPPPPPPEGGDGSASPPRRAGSSGPGRPR